MEKITGMSIGSFIIGAILLLLPAFVGAGPTPVTVHCTGGSGGPTIGSRLSAAAASASRTLFVTGTCVENATVRNLRVTIDGQGVAILIPLNTGSPAITFTGGTTDATIKGFANIDMGGNPEGNAKADAIVIDKNASTTVSGNAINLYTGSGVRVRRGGLGSLSGNTVTNNRAKSIGIRIQEQALTALGTSGGDLNTVTGSGTGIQCRSGSVVTGVATGLTNIGGTTPNDGVPTSSTWVVTAGGSNTSCFNDL